MRIYNGPYKGLLRIFLKESKSMPKEQVSMSTAVCTHIPSDPFHHVGQVTPCKLCGQQLCYSNPPAGTHPRMSKKERRKIKTQQKTIEETNARR